MKTSEELKRILLKNMHQRNPPTHPLQYGRPDARTTTGRTEVMCLLPGHVNSRGKELVMDSTQVRLISTTLSHLGLRLDFSPVHEGGVCWHILSYILISQLNKKRGMNVNINLE
jgi:hypothetical protein